MRIYMQTPPMQDQIPRFYQLCLERDLFNGWSLIKEWGQVGSPGRIKREYYDDLEKAQLAFQRARDQQSKRGYRVVFVQGQMENEQ